MRWLHDHPLVKFVATVSAVAGLLMVGITYRWHLSDERANALQQQWLEQDEAWNAEIIARLRMLERICE